MSEEKKLLELCEQSTVAVEKYNLKWYWQAGKYKFSNINLARWYEKHNNCFVNFVQRDFDLVKQQLSDQNLDMEKNYDLNFLKILRQRYGHIKFLLSGGFDSTTVFYEAVENDVFLDEVVSCVSGDLYEESNQEILHNAIPLAEKFLDSIGSFRILTTSYDKMVDIWKDPYAFFTTCTTSPMPLNPAPSSQPTQHLWTEEERNHVEDSCIIRCTEKPQLLFYKNKWYVFCLDGQLGADLSLYNVQMFWYEPENIKSLVKQSRIYRDYVLENEPFKESIKFFSLREKIGADEVLNRRPPINKDKQLPKKTDTFKDAKTFVRFSSLLNQSRYDVLVNYFRCMDKFFEVFPETKNSFEDYNSKGKFAWFIDIDSLEIYTQEELIPNGFDFD